jgi:hypothetical protein
MSRFWKTLAAQWQDGVNFLLGVWLVVAPWLLGYAMETWPAWNAHIVGVVIAVAAISALVAFQRWEEWVNVVLGAWLVVSPWLLGFSALQAATWNQVIVGVVVAALAAWLAFGEHEKRRLAT